MMPPSPILHIITGLEDGGAEAVLFRLCTHGVAADHRVVSLTGEGKYGPLLQAAGVPVTCLGMPRGRISPKGLWQLYRLLRKEKPAIVQTWMYHANLVGGVVARAAGLRRIYWGIHHTTLVPGTTGSSTRFVDWLCARLSAFVPMSIVACAERARDVHIANGYTSEKFMVIPNGYDISVFCQDSSARASLRKELGIEPSTPVVGLVGRWDPQKDHRNLVVAVAQLRKKWSALQLVLVGTDCNQANSVLLQRLSDAGLSAGVHLLGRRADIPAIMNALDVHVLSSYGEAFPNVVAEAMACGTPCVVTDVGDAALIVGDTGWVVPPRDPAALAKAMSTALSEREDADKWSERQRAARQRIVDEFSLEAMVARYREVWASASQKG